MFMEKKKLKNSQTILLGLEFHFYHTSTELYLLCIYLTNKS